MLSTRRSCSIGRSWLPTVNYAAHAHSHVQHASNAAGSRVMFCMPTVMFTVQLYLPTMQHVFLAGRKQTSKCRRFNVGHCMAYLLMSPALSPGFISSQCVLRLKAMQRMYAISCLIMSSRKYSCAEPQLMCAWLHLPLMLSTQESDEAQVNSHPAVLNHSTWNHSSMLGKADPTDEGRFRCRRASCG